MKRILFATFAALMIGLVTPSTGVFAGPPENDKVAPIAIDHSDGVEKFPRQKPPIVVYGPPEND
ncbi:hypothetical protein [Brevibacillus brevis]|uniref:hypothetical protein n=1 Tax=Brevibacillus brevis TaxID=1393 RepID=UPI000D0F2C81|nr:hypothetical protein [Brevibacillus brevis]PSJ67189.1 hypothetical protein C7J99_22820 [Brevibacillus brevis]RED25757.1 hypothetical protein DES34_112197 [Brevibacillus brevis]GEC93645.1 hypothetical protein BBR01nite_59760 [Brevibacillus brevis]VEF87223.1 Uncharacterised protein [Brevibacillus brevis]